MIDGYCFSATAKNSHYKLTCEDEKNMGKESMSEKEIFTRSYWMKMLEIERKREINYYKRSWSLRELYKRVLAFYRIITFFYTFSIFFYFVSNRHERTAAVLISYHERRKIYTYFFLWIWEFFYILVWMYEGIM